MYIRPGCSAGERSGPVPVPLSNEAAVVGTGKRGEIMSGAPKGVAGDLKGVPNPGIAGDNSLCVSAAADASLLHSSSQAAKQNTTKSEKLHYKQLTTKKFNPLLRGGKNKDFENPLPSATIRMSRDHLRHLGSATSLSL